MNKKIFIKNRPFDVDDANDMQNWTEDALKKTMASIYSSGIVEGLDVLPNSGLRLTLNKGKAFDSNYDFINVENSQSVTLEAAHATLPRYDKIVIGYSSNTVNNVDSSNIYGKGTSYIYSQNKLDSFVIQVVKGTPASSPTIPATPTKMLPLAQIYVGPAVASISASNITDLRQYIVLNSNINRPLVHFSDKPPSDTTVLWIDITKNEAKTYVGNTWLPLNSNNAETVGGKRASDFAASNHTHTDVYKKTETYSKNELDVNFLTKSDNLSALTDKAAARRNLGLGTAAEKSSSEFASSNHNHDNVYARGNVRFSVGPNAHSNPQVNDLWFDTTNKLVKIYGTAWDPLNTMDAETLKGLTPGTGPNNILKLDSGGKVPIGNIPLASGTSNGAMSIAQNNKLENIQDKAEVNQNAFSSLSVGSTNINASSKTDKVEIIPGSNINISADSVGKKMTISSPLATTSSSGAMSASDKLKVNSVIPNTTTVQANRVYGSTNQNVIYLGNGDCHVDNADGIMRLKVNDNTYLKYDTSTLQLLFGNQVRHIFNANGTKSGGTIEIDGKVYGMSPTDSPKILLEDIMLDIRLKPEGEKVYLDETFAKALDGYGIFPSNNTAVILEKTPKYFVVKGEGLCDFSIKGFRIGHKNTNWIDLTNK